MIPDHVATLIHLFGVPIRPGDARALVATLVADGSADALAAARAIGGRLELGGGLVPLTAEQRDAVLYALEEPSDALAGLHARLVLDHEDRHGPLA